MTERRKNMTEEDLLWKAAGDSPDLVQAAVNPRPSTPLKCVPHDVRLIGLKLELGYRLTNKEKERVEKYRESNAILVQLVGTLPRRR
jgi:hypothetical protein